jgi:hypothetical protein
MDSKDCNQLELLTAAAKPHREEITPELIRSIRRRPTFLAAWNYAQDFAGLEDKQVYVDLGIDASHWSKIRKGLASPPADERFDRYLNSVRNEIPLAWWVEKRGYDFLSLRRHQDDKDRRIVELEQKLADQDRAIRLLVDAQRGYRP